MKTIVCNVGPHLKLKQFETENIGQIGIYLIYRKNKQDGKLRLIYIDKSDNIGESINESHKYYRKWVEWAYDDIDYLRFSLVKISQYEELDICEEALIFYFQPPINNTNEIKFKHEDTELIFIGRKICQRERILVLKTD